MPVLAAFADALALERGVARRACPRAEALPGGLVLSRPDLAPVRYLNAVHLWDLPAAGVRDAAGLAALAERWQHDLPHRHVELADAEAADALGPELEAKGWKRGQTLFMTRPGGHPPPDALDPRARDVDEATFDGLTRELIQDDSGLADPPAALLAELADTQALLRTGTESRRFAAAQSDEPLAAMATLFLPPGRAGRRLALIDEVRTRRDCRERGLARAVVFAACTAAAEWGAEAVVIPVDATDWPQLMYARWGWTALGVRTSFTREVSGGGRV